MKWPASPPLAVPDSANVRAFWMQHADAVPAPIVGASSTVPRSLVPFLLRSKKTSSVARKYVRGDRISNFAAAWHTLVVPVVFPVWMSGVYAWENGRHAMHPLRAGGTHTVVLSALIQPDFELKSVMYDFVRLDPERAITGAALGAAWEPPASDAISAATELALKQHFVFHFASARALPAARDVPRSELVTPAQAARAARPRAKYVAVGPDVLSVELLANCVREQLRVEFAALADAVRGSELRLEYTWDPPAIFARTISPDLLDELWLDAVCTPGVVPAEVVTIAFNDFRNGTVVPRLRDRLAARVAVCRKADLPPEPAEPGVVRVLHNNSDAFGLHILTSPCAASLDGAIGSCSSAAASLCKPTAQRVLWVDPMPVGGALDTARPS